jgi:hypothetical protein
MMVEDDDVQLVESIAGIDGTSPASHVQSVHMHGYIGANFIVVASNPIVVVATSNFTIIVSYSIEIQMQQLTTICASYNLETT